MSQNLGRTFCRRRRPAALVAAACGLAQLAVLLAGLVVAQSASSEPAKRGLALSAKAAHHDQIACLGRGLWYYGWSLTPSIPGEDSLFIPMVRGQADMETMLGAPPSRRYDILLLFNEPNKVKQASLQATPAQLSQYTAQLAPYAKFLVSPTPGRAFKPWFGQYMASKEATSLLGAVAVHWYGPADFNAFRTYIRRTELTYHKPVWLTEFAVIDRPSKVYSQAEAVKFLDQALPFLEQESMVQRYAWFGLEGKKGRPYKDSAFFGDDGRLTPVGQRYLLAPLSPDERAARLARCHVQLHP